MNQLHSPERRQHPRLLKNIPVKISGADFDIVSETKNLSRTGTYCKVSQYLEPMTKLKIQLLLPFKRSNKVVTKKVSCSGVVVRSESIAGGENYNVAIYFNEIRQRDQGLLQDYITSRMAG